MRTTAMAAAGSMLSMLGAQAAHADKIDDAANVYGGRCGLHGFHYAFVPAPARGAAFMAAAGGMFSMLGAQSAMQPNLRIAFILALVHFMGLRQAFVRAPAPGAALRADAGGMLSMLGVQAVHADRSMMRRMLIVAAVVFTACATRSCRRRLAVQLSCPQPEARHACWARTRLMLIDRCTYNEMLILAVVVLTSNSPTRLRMPLGSAHPHELPPSGVNSVRPSAIQRCPPRGVHLERSMPRHAQAGHTACPRLIIFRFRRQWRAQYKGQWRTRRQWRAQCKGQRRTRRQWRAQYKGQRRTRRRTDRAHF